MYKEVKNAVWTQSKNSVLARISQDILYKLPIQIYESNLYL